MDTQEQGFYTVEEVAELLRTTSNAIYVAVAEGREGDSIPPSTKLGRRRLFLKRMVHDWMDDLFNKSSNDNTPNNQNKEAS
jgi:excisionase family DNA binding protein